MVPWVIAIAIKSNYMSSISEPYTGKKEQTPVKCFWSYTYTHVGGSIKNAKVLKLNKILNTHTQIFQHCSLNPGTHAC